MSDHLWALAAGFALDLLLGDPEWLYHPVCIIGKWISFAENTLRKRGGNLRKSAVVLTVSTIGITMLAVAGILFLLNLLGRWPFLVGTALLNWMGLAVNSLAKEAEGVKKALEKGGVIAGRKQVARIVGRDTGSLGEEELIKATIETVAENTTDGIISPLLFAAIGGPVMLWGFKAASTLDSMVGYLDDRYRDIGWSSAKLDDILNWIPARITSLMICICSAICGLNYKNSLRIIKRDHANHLSPNCAWSESAVAGALRIQLGGTHSYFGKTIEKPTIGDNERNVLPEDIHTSVLLMYVTSVFAILLLAFADLIV